MSPQRGLITEQRRLHHSRVPTMAHRLTQRRRPFPSTAATVEATHIGRRRDASAPSAPCCHPAGRTDVLMGFCCRRDLDAHRLSHSWSPSTPAATTPDTIANA